MCIINIAGMIEMVSVDTPDAASDIPTLSSATPVPHRYTVTAHGDSLNDGKVVASDRRKSAHSTTC